MRLRVVLLRVDPAHINLILRGAENGDPDEERGVHAAVPVAGVTLQRHRLDRLRIHDQTRPLHDRMQSSANL
jgi:hypothetical protein